MASWGKVYVKVLLFMLARRFLSLLLKTLGDDYSKLLGVEYCVHWLWQALRVEVAAGSPSVLTPF